VVAVAAPAAAAAATTTVVVAMAVVVALGQSIGARVAKCDDACAAEALGTAARKTASEEREAGGNTDERRVPTALRCCVFRDDAVMARLFSRA